MKCLCCGKALPDSAKNTGWHKACIKRFFGTSQIPEIDLSENALAQLALITAQKGYTVPGVQKKISLHLMPQKNPRLTMVGYPNGYILKPQSPEFVAMPEAEMLVMDMAQASGIATAPHALLLTDKGRAYITKRVDRVIVPDGSARLLAMEDFCQLDWRLAKDKYLGSYERCAKIIAKYSSRPGLDQSELFLRLVFSFLTGNSDMHLKNFSLLETGEGTGQYVLSPAYDLLPVAVLLPEDTEDTALTLHGKNRNIRRKDFLFFAEAAGLGRKPAEKMMDMLISLQSRYVAMIEESLMPAPLQKNLIALLGGRIQRIKR